MLFLFTCTLILIVWPCMCHFDQQQQQCTHGFCAFASLALMLHSDEEVLTEINCLVNQYKTNTTGYLIATPQRYLTGNRAICVRVCICNADEHLPYNICKNEILICLKITIAIFSGIFRTNNLNRVDRMQLNETSCKFIRSQRITITTTSSCAANHAKSTK